MPRIARTAATGGEMDPDFLAWSSSFALDRRLLEHDVRGSIAHVEGLRRAGLLADDEAATLTGALESLRDDAALPDDEEDVHMAVESLLGGMVGAVADKLHTGRSRNDQVATDMKLWARDAVAKIERGIDDVIAAARAWSERQGDVAMPAYTHRQVAIPVLARAWLGGAVLEPLARDRRLLVLVADELAESPLGAGAIAGTTLPIDPEQTASALGFAHGPRNPIDAVGSRDHLLLLAFACARIGMHLARVSTDIVELASDGLVKLGGAIAGGSSMMPHKRNPDLFELVRGHAALRHAELSGLLGLMQGLGSGYHRDLQHDKQLVFAAVDGVLGCLAMVALGLGHVALVEDACREALTDGDAVATDLCEALVERGMPFRDAYRKVGALVDAQRSQGKRLADLTTDDLAKAGLTADLLARLDPIAAARRRSR